MFSSLTNTILLVVFMGITLSGRFPSRVLFLIFATWLVIYYMENKNNDYDHAIQSCAVQSTMTACQVKLGGGTCENLVESFERDKIWKAYKLAVCFNKSIRPPEALLNAFSTRYCDKRECTEECKEKLALIQKRIAEYKCPGDESDEEYDKDEEFVDRYEYIDSIIDADFNLTNLWIGLLVVSFIGLMIRLNVPSYVYTNVLAYTEDFNEYKRQTRYKQMQQKTNRKTTTRKKRK